MRKKTAILIISGNSDQTGLNVGSVIIGTGQMGKVNMIITGFQHQTAFKDQPIVLQVKEQKGTFFDDAHPVTLITYNNYRSKAVVTTCTYTS
ncbi:hypothetical protein MNBD_GAMMA01-2167 [hydrothermal vent metagenome]|uniref:Uncharacterized protein n=1 Tax=hydrothermal vent metagenome TaxID=652676 RepID=A0A3B0WAA6_9ZZZZ